MKNVLILRTDHLGDLLLSTPLLRQVRNALPEARFTLVASPANAGALVGWDAVDEIREYDNSWPWRRKFAFARELRRIRWDLCLTLAPRTSAYLLGFLSGAPIRAGIVYSRRILARLLQPIWLTHPVVMDIDANIQHGVPVPHEVEQLMDVARVLHLPGLENALPGPLEFPIDTAAVHWARGWVTETLSTTGKPTPLLIGIHGAGKWLSQGWTTQDFLGLVYETADRIPGAGIVLTFGPGDTALQMTVESVLATTPDSRLVLPGCLSIARWAALLSLCRVVVSPDTGSLHLAVATGRPVVAMYEADSYVHCASQWTPWQVPYGLVKRMNPVDTTQQIVTEVTRLLAATEGGLP